jgi:protoporphyrinogen oxidase
VTHNSSERWAVVGGGLLGMALAHRLARAGRRVTLIEAGDSLGGLAGAWQVGGHTWDRHYHVILLSDTHLRGLLAELGLDDELVWGETRTGFYTDGRLHSMSNVAEFLRFPPLRLWDKLRLAATIWYASRIKDGRPLEAVPVADWLTRLSGRRTFEKIWQPLLRAKLGEGHRDASAAFIWAIIARMYAARRTGLKKEMFGYVHGGYARILERFGDVLGDEGVDIRLSSAVERVETCGDGARLTFPHGDDDVFDRVVVTAPAPVASRLCPGLSGDEHERLRGVRYQGVLCASLLLRKPLADYYVTNITESWVPFTAVIEMTALVDRSHFGGNALVYLPKYLPADDPAFGEPDAAVEERFVAALERMYPHFDRRDVLAFRVSRARLVLPVPTLNYSERLPPMVTSLPGVYLVNSAHIVNGTLNVNETLALAERAAGLLLPSPLGGEGPGVRGEVAEVAP